MITAPAVNICGGGCEPKNYLYCYSYFSQGLFLLQGIVPGAALAVSVVLGIVALAETFEIALGGVVFQFAEHLKAADGGIAVAHTLAQGHLHGLRVVHLLVAHGLVAHAETHLAALHLLDEILGGRELDAVEHHVDAPHLRWVGVFAQQLHLGGEGAQGRLDAVAVGQILAHYVDERVEVALHIPPEHALVLGAEVVYLVDCLLEPFGRAGIEQWLAVVALLGAWLQLDEHSVGLAWHGSVFSAKVSFSAVTSKLFRLFVAKAWRFWKKVVSLQNPLI